MSRSTLLGEQVRMVRGGRSLREPEETRRGRRPEPRDHLTEKNRADVIGETPVSQSSFSEKVEVVASAFPATSLNHAADGLDGSRSVIHVEHLSFNRPWGRLGLHFPIIKEPGGVRKTVTHRPVV
jgi:hypothetical protein